MPRKRINKIKKNVGKLLLASVALFIGHGTANASFEAMGSPTVKRKQKANPTDNQSTIVDSNVKSVAFGVLTSEGVASSGEKIYFGMEVLTEESRKGWETYARHADNLTNSSSGYLTGPKGIAGKTDPNDRYNNDATRSGFSDAEYKQYVDILSNKGYTKGSKTFKALNGVAAGIAGFSLSDPGTEIIYISKKPITGRFQFPKNLPENPTLKQFNEAYGDIVMAIRYNYEPDKDAAMVRGVFKNPAVLIEGGYNKIALPLFGFVGRSMEKIGHNAPYLFVEPLPDMHNLIVNSLTMDDIFVTPPPIKNKGTDYNQRPIPENIKTPDSQRGMYDSSILIKIDALKKVGLAPIKPQPPMTKAAQVPASAPKADSPLKSTVASKPTSAAVPKTTAAKPSIDFDESLLGKDLTPANVAGHFRNLKTALTIDTPETGILLNGLNSELLDQSELLTIQTHLKTLSEADKTFLINAIESRGNKVTPNRNANLQILDVLKKSIAKPNETTNGSRFKKGRGRF